MNRRKHKRNIWLISILAVPAILLITLLATMNPIRRTCERLKIPVPPGTVLNRAFDSMAFHAPKPEIQAWLARCPNRYPKEGIPYTARHALKFLSAAELARLEQTAGGTGYHDVEYHGMDPARHEAEMLEHEVSRIDPNTPWFAPQITHGIRYNGPGECSCETVHIFVDWDTETVWVRKIGE